jgi:hypothetical protein
VTIGETCSASPSGRYESNRDVKIGVAVIYDCATDDEVLKVVRVVLVLDVNKIAGFKLPEE